MWQWIIPILIIVASKSFYHICSKSTPQGINAFGTLFVTYTTAAIVTLLLSIYFIRPENMLSELTKINWSSIVLGIAIVGLEAGYIYAYRIGWQVNTAPLVANTTLAVVLVIIGAILYGETMTFKQIVGVVVCIIGMLLINL